MSPIFIYLCIYFYTAGGGDVKIESHKLNIKAKSKIGSMDNVGPGNGQTNGHKVTVKDSFTEKYLLRFC